MGYHCTIPSEGCNVIGGLAILPLNARARGPAPSTSGSDVVDEAIAFYRANVLFRNFEVKGASDRLLVYLTLFIGTCLKRLASLKADKQSAQSVLFQMAHQDFSLPGESTFPLAGLVSAAQGKADEDLIRAYLRQCREEIGRRILEHCYKDNALNKFWMAFANRKFLNKTLQT